MLHCVTPLLNWQQGSQLQLNIPCFLREHVHGMRGKTQRHNTLVCSYSDKIETEFSPILLIIISNPHYTDTLLLLGMVEKITPISLSTVTFNLEYWLLWKALCCVSCDLIELNIDVIINNIT